MHYARPATVSEATELLGERSWQILAGATDIYPAMVGRRLTQDILDLTNISSMRSIDHDDGFWRFGACTTWTDIATASLPPQFQALQVAAVQIGGLQIQNRGTIGGNLCTASPAGDSIPVLLSLSAQLELVSPRGVRSVPIADFITGYRATVLADDEFIASVAVPDRPGPSDFQKLGSRSHLVISIAMVATHLELPVAGTDAAVRISVGACSPVAKRLRGLEEQLNASQLDLSVISAYSFDELDPIDDVRGTADYRRTVVRPLVLRSVQHCKGAQ